METAPAAAWSTTRATTSTTRSCRSAPRTGRPWSSSSSPARPCPRRPSDSDGVSPIDSVVSRGAVVLTGHHPYAGQRIGLATMHAKELAVAPPFRRLLDAEIVVAPQLDTDELGTFSGEVPRPDAVVETCVMKAELAFRSLDVDCAIANEGSYGPIDAVPLVPSGVEIMAFLDRRRGIRIIETLSTHRTNWRLMRFKAGDPGVPSVAKAMGFPRYGVFVVCSSDWSHPIKGLTTVDDVVSAMNQ